MEKSQWQGRLDVYKRQVEDWTVPQLKNFLHTLYSNQHILRRMMQSDALYIDRQMMERLDEAQTPADLEARLADGLATGLLKGCRIQDGRFTLETVQDDRDPVRWQVYATLPVSYTHLDVYKRQLLGRPRRRTGRPHPWRRTDCRLHRRGGRRPCRPRRKRRARNPPLTRERSVSP